VTSFQYNTVTVVLNSEVFSFNKGY